MPYYFFNVTHGATSADADGIELTDFETAQGEAVKLCGAMLRDLGSKFSDHNYFSIELTDEDANPLYVLTVTSTDAAGRAFPAS